MDVVERIAGFVVGTRFDTIPEKARETSKWTILDTVGVTVPGSLEASARLCAKLALDEHAASEASVVGRGFETSALNAAFANGAAAHVLDYDHSFAGAGQPMAAVTPAIFALGESLGASGRRIIEAHVVGFEVSAALHWATRRRNADGGWTTQGRIVGSYGAAAACAKLLGLNAAQTRAALGITVLTANGVFHLGQMDKSLQVALAAKNAVLAAQLARAGFVSTAEGFDESLGFANGELPDETPIESLGHTYALETTGPRTKPYPCGGLGHGVIDGVLELRRAHEITPAMVESIDADVSRSTMALETVHIPKSGIEGKFSLSYILARALIHGGVPLDVFTDAGVQDPTALGLAAKVHFALDPALMATEGGTHPCRVRIRLTDGRTVEQAVDHMRGSREKPLTHDELREKFLDCTRTLMREGDAEEALRYLERLDALPSIRQLCQVLCCAERA